MSLYPIKTKNATANYFDLLFCYDDTFQGFMEIKDIPEFIKEHLKQEDYQPLTCRCGCGYVFPCVKKEKIEEVITILADQRIKALN